MLSKGILFQEQDDEKEAQCLIEAKQLMHSHPLLSLDGLTYELINLVETAESKIIEWVREYVLHQTSKSELEKLSPYWDRTEVEYVLNFLNSLDNELQSKLKEDKFKKSVEDLFKRLKKDQNSGHKIYEHYFPKQILMKPVSSILEKQLKESITRRLLSLTIFSENLERFFNASCFEYEHEEKGAVQIFRKKVIDLYFGLLKIQDHNLNLDIAVQAARQISLVCEDPNYNNERQFYYFQERDALRTERAIKGAAVSNKKKNLFANKAYELYLKSENYPNQSQSVKSMMKELKEYSEESLGYWPESEDIEQSIKRTLARRIKQLK